jgi:hypothetical protein
MASIVVSGDTSGAITIAAPAIAGTNTLTLPASTGTLVVTGGAQTIEFADGSASAPSITNSGDTNTGMFFPAADTIAFTEGGVEAMRITSAGNVGIGETSPSATYRTTIKGNYSSIIGGTLYDNGGGDQMIVGFASATSPSFVFSCQNAAGNMTFGTNNTERMRITSGGVVVVASTAAETTISGGTPIFQVTGSGFNAIGGFTRRQNDANGAALCLAKSRNTSPNSYTVVQNGDTLGAIIFIGDDGTDLDTYGAVISAQVDGTPGANDMPGRLVFSTTADGANTPTERMRITSDGAVLVGKTASDLTTSGLQLDNLGGSSGRIRCTKSASGSFSVWLNYHSGNYVGGIDMSNTATGFPTSSDIRLKKNIQEAPSALDRVKQMRIVSHDWKVDDSHVEFGVIAQELQPIAPQAVKAGDDGEEVKDTWSVDYSKLVPILTKSIQEQQVIINDLKARIETLENK